MGWWAYGKCAKGGKLANRLVKLKIIKNKYLLNKTKYVFIRNKDICLGRAHK